MRTTILVLRRTLQKVLPSNPQNGRHPITLWGRSLTGFSPLTILIGNMIAIGVRVTIVTVSASQCGAKSGGVPTVVFLAIYSLNRSLSYTSCAVPPKIGGMPNFM